MMLTEEKTKAIKPVQKSTKDVGSAEAQVALLTARISELSSHLETHKKDNHSRRGLLQMVGKRKSLLSYLKENDFESYKKVITTLNLRG